jgi:DNA-binding PadR family transcriptional regulator
MFNKERISRLVIYHQAIQMFKSNIKLCALKELSARSISGYDLMKKFRESGMHTSPGYIYPLLNDLEKKGIIRSRMSGRRKMYTLTAKGKRLAIDLEKNRQLMFTKFTKILGLIGEREEAKDFINSKKSLMDNPAFFREALLIKGLKDSLFDIVSKGDKEDMLKARKILMETSRQLRRLSRR